MDICPYKCTDDKLCICEWNEGYLEGILVAEKIKNLKSEERDQRIDNYVSALKIVGKSHLYNIYTKDFILGYQWAMFQYFNRAVEF